MTKLIRTSSHFQGFKYGSVHVPGSSWIGHWNPMNEVKWIRVASWIQILYMEMTNE